jgi:RsiW-degrading membrane proteinase PrsW (M82 family)
MNSLISYAIVVLFISSLFYILIRQVKQTVSIQKKRKSDIPKRLLIGSYLTTFSMAGFLLAFILNVLLYLQLFPSTNLTSNNTAIACSLFLLSLLISKYGIMPKEKNAIL